MPPPVITLLTDFGLDGPYVAAVKGALLTRCPEARLVDISHQVAPHHIAAGSYLLASVWSFFPPGAVHLAVVDPGVGGPRRPLAAAGGGHFFVGPDNGLFTLLLDRGVIAEVREIDRLRLNGAPVSPTFHARDVFAPLAARLAQGQPFREVGPRVDDPVRAAFAQPRREGFQLHLQVLYVDRFGNVTVNLTPAELDAILGQSGARGVELEDPAWSGSPFVATYSEGPPGRPFFLWGSSGWLEIAADRESAAEMLNVRTGDALTIVLRS